MISTDLTSKEISSTKLAIDYIITTQKSTDVKDAEFLDNISKTITLMDALNVFLKFILDNLVSNGKIKIGLFDLPSIWKEAKKLIEQILSIFPGKDIMRRLESQPFGIGDIIIDYLVWCFQNIISVDNKVKIPILKIIPFIVKTIKFVRSLVDHFKRKGIING